MVEMCLRKKDFDIRFRKLGTRKEEERSILLREYISVEVFINAILFNENSLILRGENPNGPNYFTDRKNRSASGRFDSKNQPSI